MVDKDIYVIQEEEGQLANFWKYSETSGSRTPTGPKKFVRYWEVSAIGR